MDALIRHSAQILLGHDGARVPGATTPCYLDLEVSQREFRSVKEFTDLPGQVD